MATEAIPAPEHGTTDLYPGEVHPHCVCTIDPATGMWTLGISKSGPCEVCIEAQDAWNGDLADLIVTGLGVQGAAAVANIKPLAARYTDASGAFAVGNPGRLPDHPGEAAKKVTELELGELREGLLTNLGPGWKSWLAALVAAELERRRKARMATRSDVTEDADLFVSRSAEGVQVTEAGDLTGYAATWAFNGDGIQFSKGSFTKTLKERKGKVPILVNRHTQQGGTVMETVGWVEDGVEDEKGVLVRASFLATPFAQAVRAQVRAGGIRFMSVWAHLVQKVHEAGHYVCSEAAMRDVILTNTPLDYAAEIAAVRGADAPTVVAENATTAAASPPAPAVAATPPPPATPPAPETPPATLSADERIRMEARQQLLERQYDAYRRTHAQAARAH